MYAHQQIPERVAMMAKTFSRLEDITAEHIAQYQILDAEIVEAIKAAAASVGRKNFGYQQSPALCEAGAAVRMHKAIFSCVRRGTEFTSTVLEIAERIRYKLPSRSEITHKVAQANVSKAWRAKRQIEIEDAEHRADWLEELAAEKAAESGGTVDKELERMIAAAKTSGVFKRLKSILKSEWPTTKAFEHILADHGTSAVVDEILEGTYDPSNLDLGMEMELFIRQLQRTPEEHCKRETPIRTPI
jgi:hypothetical protein